MTPLIRRFLLLAIATVGLLNAPSALAGNDACAFGSDAGDVHVYASILPRPVWCQGTLSATDVSDWYYVDIPATAVSDSIYVSVCMDTGTTDWDADLNVYLESGGVLGVGAVSAPGRLVGSSTYDQTTCDEVSYSTGALDLPAGGRWYIQVYRYGGSGTYDLSVS